MSELPTWEQMSDLDKGAALLHLHKREWEGAELRRGELPGPLLRAPGADRAERETPPAGMPCRWRATPSRAGALKGEEYIRLYELALDHERTAPALHSQQENEGITGMGWDNLGHGG